mmetsp:Transcript_47018/g.102324  ORF Transcript_47018/g.102324 Transcript_47018/m.102324 type:complete len:164 (+) Transcript_47018:49-540(+)
MPLRCPWGQEVDAQKQDSAMSPTPPAGDPDVASRPGSSRPAASGGVTPSRCSSVPALPAIAEPGGYQKPSLGETLARMRKVKPDHTAHLRRSPLQMGAPSSFTTTYMHSTSQPISKANDPKWSTDLKKMDRRLGEKNKYERALCGCTGALSPELRYLPATYKA